MCKDCRAFDSEYDGLFVLCPDKVLPPGIQAAHAHLTTAHSRRCSNFKPITGDDDE